MLESKWKKKYKQAMKTVEFWKQFYETRSKNCSENPHMSEIYTAQKIAYGDILRDMKEISES